MQKAIMTAHTPNFRTWLTIAAAAFILLVTIGLRMTLGLFDLPSF